MSSARHNDEHQQDRDRNEHRRAVLLDRTAARQLDQIDRRRLRRRPFDLPIGRCRARRVFFGVAGGKLGLQRFDELAQQLLRYLLQHAATITFGVHEAGDRSRVTVDTDLKIVGKLAQFGGGMLQQVSEKLLGEFVESLEAKLAAGNAEEEAARTAPTNGQVERPAPEPAPIDLIELAGGGAIKKYGPAVLVAIAVLLVFIVVSRRRH